MKQPSRRERAIAHLNRFGWVVDPDARSTRYVTMRKPGKVYKYYIGKIAVRRGDTVASSIPVKLSFLDEKTLDSNKHIV